MKWLTVSEVSERTEIPPETVRRYLTRHSLHLQSKKGHKSYQIAESSIPVFMQIRTLYAEGKQADEVETALAKSGRPTIISVNEHGESTHVNVVEYLATLDAKMNAIATMLMNVDERLKLSEQDHAAVKEDIKTIRQDFIAIHGEISTAQEKLINVSESVAGIRNDQEQANAQLGLIGDKITRMETHKKSSLFGWFGRK